MSAKEKLVVIGGVAAGMSAASSAMRVRPDMEAIVYEKDFYISYGICSVPYYISGDVQDFRDLISLTPEEAETEKGVRVFTWHEVLKIDIKGKTVIVKNHASGEELGVSYDKLVIASGGLPVIPPFSGINLSRIFTVRNLHDALDIKKFVDEWNRFEVCDDSRECVYENRFGVRRRPMKAVIVGGGYIGMEMCEAFRKRGLDVSVIEKADRVLGTMNPEITEIVEKK